MTEGRREGPGRHMPIACKSQKTSGRKGGSEEGSQELKVSVKRMNVLV